LVKQTTRAGRRKLKKSKLTDHQLKVMKAATDAQLQGKSLRSAAQTIWPNQTPEAASASMSRVLKSVNVNEVWKQMMAVQGFTPEGIMSPVLHGLQATKPMEMRYWIEDEEAKLDAETDGIEVSDTSTVKTKIRHVPDHSTRINAAKTAAAWLGVGKKADSDDPPAGDTTVVFNQQVNQYIKK
jgi:hypothetical protein